MIFKFGYFRTSNLGFGCGNPNENPESQNFSFAFQALVSFGSDSFI